MWATSCAEPGDLVINTPVGVARARLGVSRHRWHRQLRPTASIALARRADDCRHSFTACCERRDRSWKLRVGRRESDSSRTSTYSTFFSDAPMLMPPPDEQAAIVRFLDWANGRLERAIRAKRKVIALLNEQKQAIIHRAVTRGLDPSVPLKPSGIPWLGDIPQHWEVRALKYAASRRSRLPRALHELDASGLAVARITSRRDQFASLSTTATSSDAARTSDCASCASRVTSSFITMRALERRSLASSRSDGMRQSSATTVFDHVASAMRRRF